MAAVVVATEDVAMDEIIEAARERGTDDGENAGSWVFDGNTDDPAYRLALQWDADGDPRYEDNFGSPDPLDGQWAEQLTPAKLIDELGYADLSPEEEDEVSSAYEEAFRDAYRDEVLRVARSQIEG